MLESASLLVRDEGIDGSSVIEDGATGQSLGTARRKSGVFGWLPTRRVLQVREGGDAPLVFTVRRGWSLAPCFEVHDSEGRPVGSIAGPVAVDRDGRRVAVLEPDGVFRTRAGAALATVIREKRGTQINFNDTPADPFARMLLLAAVLQQ